MPYREHPSSPDPARGNPSLTMTWERLKDKLRAHGVNGWRDGEDSKANAAAAEDVALERGAQRDKRIP